MDRRTVVSRISLMVGHFGTVAVLVAGLSACGNLTAGGFAGVDVSLSGDAPEGQGTPEALVAVNQQFASEAEIGQDDPEGELEAEFTLALLAANGAVEVLSSNPVRLRVDLEGRQEADAVSTTVPAGTYNALRVTFTDFEIEVDAGLIINGVPIVGAIEVELEDGVLQVDKPLALDLLDGDQVSLLVDMNAATWLQAIDADLRTVAEAVVGDAISVIVR